MKKGFGAFLFLGFLSSALFGCGGGGGGSSVLTGRFIDGPVSGLHYVIGSGSGITDINGEFNYGAGEIVSFYVDDILIGQAAGAATITPYDLAGTVLPTNPLAFNFFINELRKGMVTASDRVVNIAVFLQTLSESDNALGVARVTSTFILTPVHWIYLKDLL